MRKIYIALYFMLWVISCNALTTPTVATRSIHGLITDKDTHEPLAGVSVYLPDLKVGTTSDTEGKFVISNLPAAPVLFQLSYVSYRTEVIMIDLSAEEMHDFEMEYAATEINEVIVTGVGRSTEQKRNPAPVMVITKSFLLRNTASNLVDALASQPGISQITTGTGISKPVIRGMGYNRVVVIHEGIRQENQQWGDEHGLEIDENGVDRVEILKGPASLAYGSDALAGVINLLAAPFEPEGRTKAALTAGYQTNNGLYSLSADMAGNRNGFVWDLRLSRKQAHAYRNRYDGYVFNSGFNENDLAWMAGIIRSWGYINLTASLANLNPGIVEGERDSTTGSFITPKLNEDGIVDYEIADQQQLHSYSLQVPYQGITHLKSVLTGNLYLGKANLKTTVGFQQNRRKEFADISDRKAFGLCFLLNTVNYDVRLNLPQFHNLSVSTGVNGMWQSSQNRGSEFLVPAYNLWDGGIYGITRWNKGKVDITGGVRYDLRWVNGQQLLLNAAGIPVDTPDPGTTTRFEEFRSSFGGISGSLGTSFQMTRALYTKLNISRGFRAPNIAELGSNGIHEGTGRFETGNSGLKPETGTQLDFTEGLNTEHISAEVNLFAGSIANYIFQRKVLTGSGADSLTDGAETFRYVSGKALLTGGEIRIDIHPHPFDFIHFENAFSWVKGLLPDGPVDGKDLPMIPPSRFQSSLRVDLKDLRRTRNVFFTINLEWNFRQDHFYGLYNTETSTPAYTLIHAGVGGDIIRRRKTLFSVYVNVSNLANTPYQSHLSRLKYTPINEVTGRSGIYNMGRNVGIRIIVPFSIQNNGSKSAVNKNMSNTQN